ncbi:MAG: phenylalanine--tRNA ligase subunit beta [Thermodesulfobacteriota bacterium]
MRLNYNWLSEYVDLDGVSAAQLADRLTMAGLEVEDLHDRYAYLDRVVAARVNEVRAIPGSEHLKLCLVDAGGQTYQTVCGAPNVAPGMISALALAGTELPGGRVVGEAEFKGVRSTGMLCSEFELLVGGDASGILALPAATKPGQGLKQTLGLSDWLFEIGITPNRPDCLCVLGVAREAAGLLGRPLRRPRVELIESGERIEDLSSITILAPDHCPRYVARIIRQVKIGPSPFWLVDRLTAAGLRSINNVVDVTNFVLMEIGQPLHAFDLDRLLERRIVVKTAGEGDRFVTLDGTERILTPAMLMICDGQRPVALAGVMGGLNSEIAPDTTDVLLESAYFNPISTRRTSKTLGLSTEASYRFERGLDPNLCLYAADRAIALMREVAGGVVAPGFLDAYPRPARPVTLSFSPAKCNAFLGTDFTAAEMSRILGGIELKVTGQGENLVVDVPSFRVDLYREVDLFEEVARLAGFDRVPATLPPARAPLEPLEPSRLLRAEARKILEGLGLNEAINYSFIAEGFPDKLGLPADDPRRRTVRILNPLSEEQALMRTTLAPGLLDNLRRNQSFGVWDVDLYEIGLIFLARADQELPEERLTIGGIMSGRRGDLSWHQKAEPVDLYDVKGVVEDLLAGLNLPDPGFDRLDLPAYYDASSAARVVVDGHTLGWLGRVAGPISKAFGIKAAGGETGDEAYMFELDAAELLAVRLGVPQFTPLPRFPLVERDLALVLDKTVETAKVIKFVLGLGEEYLAEAFLFDVYEGRQVGAGKKSLAVRLRYRSLEKTLTDEEVNAVHGRIIERTTAEFSASLRT